jgi:hypothetical protein
MADPPVPSSTQDNATHHTSPADPASVQVPLIKAPVKTPNIARQVTGTVRRFSIPDHVTKHPNPVGRPRNRRP